MPQEKLQKLRLWWGSAAVSAAASGAAYLASEHPQETAAVVGVIGGAYLALRAAPYIAAAAVLSTETGRDLTLAAGQGGIEGFKMAAEVQAMGGARSLFVGDASSPDSIQSPTQTPNAASPGQKTSGRQQG